MLIWAFSAVLHIVAMLSLRENMCDQIFLNSVPPYSEASLKSILSLCKSASLSVTLPRYIRISSTNACGQVFAHREVIHEH